MRRFNNKYNTYYRDSARILRPLVPLSEQYFFLIINKQEYNKGNAKRGVSPRLKIWLGDLDLWPWKSIGFHILLRTFKYSTAQRENTKSASFQGLSQHGINEKSVCIRGRSAKQDGHDGQNAMSSRIVIIEMFIHNEYYYTWLYLQSFILRYHNAS